jgi:hypothetical protein
MKTHIKALSAILCFALLSACGNVPEVSEITRENAAETTAATIAATITETTAETTTAQTEEELVFPEIVVVTRAIAMEVTEAPIEPPAEFSDEDYIKSANAAMFGQVAFDEEYIYYISKAENGTACVMKRPIEKSPYLTDIPVALGNEYGFIHSLKIKGDELYYVSRYDTENDIEGTEGATPPCLFAVKTDGSNWDKPELVTRNVGDYYFFDGDNIIYTADPHSDGGTYVYNTLTGEKTGIEAGGVNLSFADGELLYNTGMELGIYDIEAGKTTWSIPTPGTGVTAMIRYENKLIYSYRYGSENTKTVTGIAYYDIDTKEHHTVKDAVTDKNIPEGQSAEEYIKSADNQWISDGFTIWEGKLVFYCYAATYNPSYEYNMLLREYFNEATLYSFNFETDELEILVPKTHLISTYPVFAPLCALYSTPGGIYTYYDPTEPVKIYY